MIPPCKTNWGGRQVADFCDECDHVLLAHTSARVCSVCDAVTAITEEIAWELRSAKGVTT